MWHMQNPRFNLWSWRDGGGSGRAIAINHGKIFAKYMLNNYQNTKYTMNPAVTIKLTKWVRDLRVDFSLKREADGK